MIRRADVYLSEDRQSEPEDAVRALVEPAADEEVAWEEGALERTVEWTDGCSWRPFPRVAA